MEARLRAGARIDALEPRIHVLQRRIDLLAHARAEVERAVQDDVRNGEALAGDPLLALEQAIEPLEVVLHGRFHPGGAFGNQAHPALEDLLAFGEAKAVVEKLGDLEFDAALPLARFRALFWRGADQGRVGMLLLEVLPDGDGFADALSVVEFEGGELTA